MSKPRITYADWIVELGSDPDVLRRTAIWQDTSFRRADENLKRLRQNVQAAVERLSENERYLIIRRFYLGQSLAEISRQSGRNQHRLFAMQQRALKKLKRELAEFVRDRFRIRSVLGEDCPLCSSPNRDSIDQLIAGRDRSRSWRPVIDALDCEFSIKIRSPMILIGHEKYH